MKAKSSQFFLLEYAYVLEGGKQSKWRALRKRFKSVELALACAEHVMRPDEKWRVVQRYMRSITKVAVAEVAQPRKEKQPC